MPNSQPGAAALGTSNLMALLPSRLLSLRRRPAVLLTGTLAGTADLRPGRQRGITAPRRLQTGIGTKPSPDPQVQMSGILQNRTAAAVHNEHICFWCQAQATQMHRQDTLVCPIRHLLQFLPAGSLSIRIQGTRARLRLRTGMQQMVKPLIFRTASSAT